MFSFFENGIGNILSDAKRKKALENMVELLTPNGTLVLGVRSTDPFGRQLIPDSMDNIFIGVYNTVSVLEMESFFKKLGGSLLIIDGDSRPAGGKEVFFIFKK